MKIEFIDLVSEAGLDGLDLSFGLDALTVLHDPYEVLSGPILSALAGQSEILSGSLLIDGVPLGDSIDGKALHRVFGYVFDEGIMLANLSLRENLLLPLRWLDPRLSDADFEGQLKPWLELFDLRVDLKLRPAMVKPAVRKYLSYVRSLLLKPDYLLIDDPYYLLNKYERGVMYQALSRLRSTHRMLIASSDDDFTGSFSSNCLELADLYPTD
ncbi:MAG TPA: hypothetical protein PKI63_09120 [Candidatus Cloacimonadota bacterium]|nr:hypothetical protein [Candidatus Cloacimonadota bacterium]